MLMNSSPSSPSSSSTKPTDSTGTATSGERTFSTERFPFAIFIHATNALRFLGCETIGNGKAKFVFSDPDGRAEELELAFDSGAQVSAIAFVASQKLLRRKLGVALGEGPRDGRLGEQFGGRRLERGLERQDGNLNGRDGRDDGNRKGNHKPGDFYNDRYR